MTTEEKGLSPPPEEGVTQAEGEDVPSGAGDMDHSEAVRRPPVSDRTGDPEDEEEASDIIAPRLQDEISASAV